MHFLRYHEDISHLHMNTLPNHAHFIPHADADSTLSGGRACSERWTRLSGKWHFGYYDSFLDLPEDLFFPAATPDTIPVPSVWQCHGYDAHQYINARFPIPVDPPYVPWKNPCGLYTRIFQWEAEVGETTLREGGLLPVCMDQPGICRLQPGAAITNHLQPHSEYKTSL